MNKSTLNRGLMALLSFTLFFISCKKDSANGGNDQNVESAQNNSLAESYYNDVTTLVDLAAYNGSNMSFRSSEENDGAGIASCVTVTVDTINSPRSITIDFGTSNCLCIDGRNRRGKILASYTGKYKDSGTVISITFDNYFVNDHQIKGTKTVTNTGKNPSGNLVYLVGVNGEIIKPNNGGTITWSSEHEREWMAGSNTPLNIPDDVYGITGYAFGTIASGDEYTVTITEKLVRKMNCKWFESGAFELTPEDKPAITFDYGDSGCDANATVTIAGKTYNILLQ